jgi:hypothetical protein
VPCFSPPIRSSHHENQIFLTTKLAAHRLTTAMSTTTTNKRKSSTPPPSTHKKRKHKHSKATASAAALSQPPSAPQLFSKARLKVHIAVPPSATTFSSLYVHSHLTSTLLLKHTAQGTIVSLRDFNSTGGTGRILDECPFAWSWFEGDIVLFHPQIGQLIRIALWQ